uniref:RAP domain-containing protein n=1 Tax=Chromera velia CCMP2878 TaxID=1169474 RepID=A0A0G4HSW9_9ALVE|eukprot:Cvel_8346.t1-p1 / transcript=Cvel_8346.t1 / gene=Cvel_8346 / organism=Chromera_velia_CCMP2878 / gene_product=hypothetical protein / transcript_product=hypothetical protein / location=Cvel_scaffold459:57825-65268(+) / protein_length=1288 / sequence_SO=supercontig / SO=protein_coding / is_pseudo=false
MPRCKLKGLHEAFHLSRVPSLIFPLPRHVGRSGFVTQMPSPSPSSRMSGEGIRSLSETLLQDIFTARDLGDVSALPFLARRTEAALPRLQPSEVASVCKQFSKGGLKDVKFWTRIAAHSSGMLHLFSAEELVFVMGALAKAGICKAPLWREFDAQVSRQMPSFSVHGLALAANAYVRARQINKALFLEMSASIRAQAGGLNPQLLSTVLHAWNKAGLSKEDPLMFKVLATVAAPSLSLFEPAHLANGFFAFANCTHTNAKKEPALWQAAAAEACSKVQRFSSQEFAVFGRALWKGRVRDPCVLKFWSEDALRRLEVWHRGYYRFEIRRGNRRFNSQELSMVASSLLRPLPSSSSSSSFQSQAPGPSGSVRLDSYHSEETQRRDGGSWGRQVKGEGRALEEESDREAEEMDEEEWFADSALEETRERLTAALVRESLERIEEFRPEEAEALISGLCPRPLPFFLSAPRSPSLPSCSSSSSSSSSLLHSAPHEDSREGARVSVEDLENLLVALVERLLKGVEVALESGRGLNNVDERDVRAQMFDDEDEMLRPTSSQPLAVGSLGEDRLQTGGVREAERKRGEKRGRVRETAISSSVPPAVLVRSLMMSLTSSVRLLEVRGQSMMDKLEEACIPPRLADVGVQLLRSAYVVPFLIGGTVETLSRVLGPVPLAAEVGSFRLASALESLLRGEEEGENKEGQADADARLDVPRSARSVVSDSDGRTKCESESFADLGIPFKNHGAREREREREKEGGHRDPTGRGKMRINGRPSPRSKDRSSILEETAGERRTYGSAEAGRREKSKQRETISRLLGSALPLLHVLDGTRDVNPQAVARLSSAVLEALEREPSCVSSADARSLFCFATRLEFQSAKEDKGVRHAGYENPELVETMLDSTFLTRKQKGVPDVQREGVDVHCEREVNSRAGERLEDIKREGKVAGGEGERREEEQETRVELRAGVGVLEGLKLSVALAQSGLEREAADVMVAAVGAAEKEKEEKGKGREGATLCGMRTELQRQAAFADAQPFVGRGIERRRDPEGLPTDDAYTSQAGGEEDDLPGRRDVPLPCLHGEPATRVDDAIRPHLERRTTAGVAAVLRGCTLCLHSLHLPPPDAATTAHGQQRRGREAEAHMELSEGFRAGSKGKCWWQIEREMQRNELLRRVGESSLLVLSLSRGTHEREMGGSCNGMLGGLSSLEEYGEGEAEKSYGKGIRAASVAASLQAGGSFRESRGAEKGEGVEVVGEKRTSSIAFEFLSVVKWTGDDSLHFLSRGGIGSLSLEALRAASQLVS